MPVEIRLAQPRAQESLSSPWLPHAAALLLSAAACAFVSRWLLQGSWEAPEALARAALGVAVSMELLRLTFRAACAAWPAGGASSDSDALSFAAAGVWIVPFAAWSAHNPPLLAPPVIAAGFAAGKSLRSSCPSEVPEEALTSWRPFSYLLPDGDATPVLRPRQAWTAALLMHAGGLAALWPAPGPPPP